MQVLKKKNSSAYKNKNYKDYQFKKNEEKMKNVNFRTTGVCVI